MKKTILAVAFVAIAMVSCDPKKSNTDEPATTGTEVEQKVDTIAQKTEEAVDTTKAKAGEALEKAGEKTKEAGKELKEAAKK
jgi:hypothetical protein